MPMGEPFDIVHRYLLSLPAGDYRLKITGKGRVGRIYRVAVNRGETDAFKLSLDEGRLLGAESRAFAVLPHGHETRKEEPISIATRTVALELTPGKADLLEWNLTGVIRRDGVTGKPVWETSIPANSSDPNRRRSGWMPKLAGYYRPGLVIEPAADLDGDGIGDFVWAFRSGDALHALSGKDGSTLWSYIAEFDIAHVSFLPPESRYETIFDTPAVFDCDRDGTPDVVATLARFETREEQKKRAAEETRQGFLPNKKVLHKRLIVAISGRTGRSLWSYSIERAFELIRQGHWSGPAVLVLTRDMPLIVYVDGGRWIGLDSATGRLAAGPIDLGFAPVRPVQHADLDGDGQPEILALGRGPSLDQQTLVAFSSVGGRQMWVETIGGQYDQRDPSDPSSDWPMVVDLDGDGRTEIAVPDSGPLTPRGDYRGIRLLDGATGKTRWVRPIKPVSTAETGLDRLLYIPAVDGDGTRDFMVVARLNGLFFTTSGGHQPGEPERLYVDAFSGKEGRPLWWWHVDLARDRLTRIWKPQLWGRGLDGWPIVAIALGGRLRNSADAQERASRIHPPIVYALELSTGREVHTINGLTQPRSSDFDGDGLVDLWGEFDGEIRAFRGETPELWRGLGSFGRAGDLDADGVADVVTDTLRIPYTDWANDATGSRTALARSGRDGRVIWKARPESRENSCQEYDRESSSVTAIPLPEGDVNRDGVTDVFVERSRENTLPRGTALPIQLLDGHTGSRLWNAGPMPSSLVGFGDARISQKYLRVVERHAAPDAVVIYAARLVEAGSTQLPPTGRESLVSRDSQDATVRSSGIFPCP